MRGSKDGKQFGTAITEGRNDGRVDPAWKSMGFTATSDSVAGIPGQNEWWYIRLDLSRAAK